MKTMIPYRDIKLELCRHLNGGGTLNDLETDRLYRLWHRIPEEDDTDLETVEAWAVGVASEALSTL